LKSHVLFGILCAFRVVRIEGPRQLAVTRYCLRSFFDSYLKGPPPARLAIATPSFPEIQVLE